MLLSLHLSFNALDVHQARISTGEPHAACNWRRTERTENWCDRARWEKRHRAHSSGGAKESEFPRLNLKYLHATKRYVRTWASATLTGAISWKALGWNCSVAFWMSNLIIYDDDNKSAPRDNCRAIWERFTAELKLNQVLIYIYVQEMRSDISARWGSLATEKVKKPDDILVKKKTWWLWIFEPFCKTSTKNYLIITCNLQPIWDHAGSSHNFTLRPTRAKFALITITTHIRVWLRIKNQVYCSRDTFLLFARH